MKTDPLSPEQLRQAGELKASGMSTKEIAAKMDLPTWRFHQSDGYRALRPGPIKAPPNKRKQAKASSMSQLEKFRALAVDFPVKVNAVPDPQADRINESGVTISLSASKVQKLLDLLLQ